MYHNKGMGLYVPIPLLMIITKMDYGLPQEKLPG